MVSGLREIVLSVFDIGRIARPMMEVGGYTCQDLPDAPAAQFGAWHVPKACQRIEQCLLRGENSTTGDLRLVVFHGVRQSLIRSSQTCWDSGGIFDVDIFARDAASAYRALQAHGWTAFSDPVDYVIGPFDVREVVAVGPDGLNVALIQPFRPTALNLPDYRALSRIFNSTQIVRNFEASLEFFVDVLRWKVLMTSSTIGLGEPASVLGLPMPACEAVERKVAIVSPDGSNDGSLELLQCAGLAGRDFAALAVAPNIGLLTARFEVDDAPGYATLIKRNGGGLYTAPMQMEIAPYGRVTLFSIRTPDGAILEFYQRLDGPS